MYVDRISLDTVILIFVFKCCGSIELLDIRAKIYTTIKEEGFLGKDIVFGLASVDMFA